MWVQITRGVYLGKFAPDPTRTAAAKDDIIDLPVMFARQIIGCGKAIPTDAPTGRDGLPVGVAPDA
jgi:predicted RNase H-like nuclease